MSDNNTIATINAILGDINKHSEVEAVLPYSVIRDTIKIIWDNGTDNPSNMNNFVIAGVYDISGEHTRYNDNIPIINIGSGHTISARLEVLDSSINDTTNDDDDKCITQKLTLSNRVGGDGNVYIRTGRGKTLGSITWEPWATLQTNINVGDTRTLNKFVDNGIYSGVWTDEYDTFAETFVMVVINDYAVAGDEKTITQFKYAYDTLAGSGIPTFTTRSLFNGEWSKWTSIKGGGGSGGGDYTLPIATGTVLGGVKIKEDSFNSSGLRIENDGQLSLYQGGVKVIPGIYDINGVELRKVKDGGIYTGLINRGDEELPFILVVSHNLSNSSINPFILQQLTYVNEDGNIVMLNRMMEGEENSLSHAIEWQSVGGGGSGGSNYTLPIATTDVLGGIKSNSAYGYIGENPFGREHAVNVGNDGRATVTIPIADNKNCGIVKVDSAVSINSSNPVSAKAVAEAIANISGGGGGDITATPTEEVINGIEPTLVSTALRKTPQVLTDAEKEIARGNIGAVAHSDLNNAIANAITNTLNTAV